MAVFVNAEIIGGPKDGEVVYVASHWDAVVIDENGEPVLTRNPPVEGPWYVHHIHNRRHVLVYTGDSDA